MFDSRNVDVKLIILRLPVHVRFRKRGRETDNIKVTGTGTPLIKDLDTYDGTSKVSTTGICKAEKCLRQRLPVTLT
jgi:hypothetical protein